MKYWLFTFFRFILINSLHAAIGTALIYKIVIEPKKYCEVNISLFNKEINNAKFKV